MMYVMLSRVCALWQIFILNKFDESKMYPNKKALKELARLEEISQNKNPTHWEIEDKETMKISSLNCRSLKKHHQDIISDNIILKSDVIFLQETWLEDDTSLENLRISNYELHLNSNGKGKGIAIYYKKDTLQHAIDIKEENMQLSKFTSSTIDIVVLYRSQGGNLKDLTMNLEGLISRNKPQLIIGDFNFCYIENSSNSTKKYLKENHFKQLILEPTHIEGNLLDQAHVRDIQQVNKYSTEMHSKYFTDHKGLAIMIEKNK